MKRKEPFDVKLIGDIDAILAKLEKLPAFITKPLGGVFIALGICMLVLPGPGILMILAGFALISKKFGAKLAGYFDRYIQWRTSWKSKIKG